MFFITKRLIFLTAVVSSLFALSGQSTAVQTAAYSSPDLLAMQGTWIRNDAPYSIELQLGSDNKLTARYFNRRYIHVEKTETALQNGKQFLMIQLQDKHYDGSIYVLGYERKLDALQGIYVHGASRQSFSVIFTRKKN